MDDNYDVEMEDMLPDVSGLTPVRSLDDLRKGAAATARERLAPEVALRRYFGYESFRPLQAEAIHAVIAKRDALVVLPTGGGKSLCYQIPAACGMGLVVVISPLIALMDDQVAAANEAGLRAIALHSNLDEADRRTGWAQLQRGEVDLLYASPERLLTGDWATRLSDVALFAVDEAHCVSHWGHDFRPEYRQLRQLLDRLPQVPRLALTATATPQVQDDICTQLGLRRPERLIGHVDRPNLIYRAIPRQQAITQIMTVINRHPGEGGIVYAQTRREVDQLTTALKKGGVQADAYHAGLPAETRQRVQDDFVNERLDVVVATIAFGMGIDRSNVRWVVHANAPKSIEHYQQEAGRAGRDGLPADCVLLYSAGDFATHRRLASMDGPLSPERAKALDLQLRGIGRYAVAPVCRHRLLTEHFGQVYQAPETDAVDEATSKNSCAACDVCLGETQELPTTEAMVTAQKIISAAWRLDGRYGAGYCVDVLLGRRSDRGERAGHDRLSVFGLLKDAGEPAVRAWVDQLVVQGFLSLRDEGRYSFLEMTDNGRALCRGEGSVRLGQIHKPTPRTDRRRAASATTTAVPAADNALFEQLRVLRKSLAATAGVPPYVVFHDATLQAIASAKPRDLSALTALKGIGERKAARYGEAVLACVREALT